jgi:2-aminoethylphosphonate-pyruvate transaminase
LVLAPRLTLRGEGVLSAALITRVKRTLGELKTAGVTDVSVVDGAHPTELAAALGSFPGMTVEVLGTKSWRQAGGSAVRRAKAFLCAADEPCLVLSGDRPIDRKSLRALLCTSISADDAVLLVAEPPPQKQRKNLMDVVKVRLDGERVVALGCDLENADALSTGHAVIHPSLLADFAHMSNPSLEEALEPALARGRLMAQSSRLAWPGGPQPIEVEGQVAAILDSKAHPRFTLLNPGPVNTTARVKSALVHHDVCHRDASFSELLVSLTGRLKRVFRASSEHSICVITGSGTAAMECALSSCVPEDKKILIIDNGAFGERLLEIARVHRLNMVSLSYAWGELIKPADVARLFAEHSDIAAVAMIHHETSVGLLNPVREIGKIARQNDALFIVDAISSLGAEDIDVVRDQIDVCFSSANKCLHAVSGVGFLCVAPRVWPRIAAIPPRSYYLDLRRYKNYADELAQTPFTPAVSSYFALDAACGEFLEQGHSARFAMYRARKQRLLAGMAALGMTPFTHTGTESNAVSTVSAPPGVAIHDLYDRMRDRGFIVYACKGLLAERFLQIANMGDLDDAQLDRFLATLGEVVAELSPQVACNASATASSRH